MVEVLTESRSGDRSAEGDSAIMSVDLDCCKLTSRGEIDTLSHGKCVSPPWPGLRLEPNRRNVKARCVVDIRVGST